MNNIERTLKYHDLYMYHDLENIGNDRLPDGYHYEFFQEGDEVEWAKIEMSAGEVLTIDDGLKAFHKSFGQHYDEMSKRCLFIANKQNEKIATSTAYFTNEHTGKVHWVAIKKEEQGNHLSKPLVNKTLSLLKELNYKDTLLHTQTHTWLAVKIYLDLGFVPYQLEERLEGWKIIKAITNHSQLNDIEESKDIFDEIFVSIHQFINEHYSNCEYKIWDDFNVFKVKHHNEIITYEYTYSNQKLFTRKL